MFFLLLPRMLHESFYPVGRNLVLDTSGGLKVGDLLDDATRCESKLLLHYPTRLRDSAELIMLESEIKQSALGLRICVLCTHVGTVQPMVTIVALTLLGGSALLAPATFAVLAGMRAFLGLLRIIGGQEGDQEPEATKSVRRSVVRSDRLFARFSTGLSVIEPTEDR